MHRDRDFDRRQALPWNEAALTQDLELDTLLRAMAADDRFLFDVARTALLSGLKNDSDTILYRQDVLKDCLKNPTAVRNLYGLTVEAIEGMKKHWWGIFSDYTGPMLYSSVELMRFLWDMLRKLRRFADRQASAFESEGFKALFAMIRAELTDEYLARIRNHLTQLEFRKGVYLSAELGEANEGTNFILHQQQEKRLALLDWILRRGRSAYTFRLDDRDQIGARILAELRDRAIARVAVTLARSADHVRGFFEMLRTELAFYVGCLNLYERLTIEGEPTCFPRPVPAGERKLRFTGLYDPCLSLLVKRRVVGNAADADGKRLVVITGANQGGKSVFLRSIGLAQIMMQCGMFVAAESFEGELCTGLFTHYKRPEDPTMKHGKLDEELARMSEIADHLVPNSFLLCNESFAATNEREGSEIAKQIVCALLEKGIKVFVVTHLYEFAHYLFDREGRAALFLRAERNADGTRTFRLVEGKPLDTSHAEDLYRELFPAWAEEGCGTTSPPSTEPIERSPQK